MPDKSVEETTGREGGGDSGGGAYPNPHTDKTPKNGFVGHGGQTELFEKKPGEPNPTSGSDDQD